MISRRTTRCIATIYKKISFYFSIPLPFFFFFSINSINSRYEYAARICSWIPRFTSINIQVNISRRCSTYFSRLAVLDFSRSGYSPVENRVFLSLGQKMQRTRFPKFVTQYSPEKFSHGSFDRTFRGGTLEKIFEDAKGKKSGTDEEKFPVGPNCGRNKTTLCSFLGSYTSPLFLYDTFAIISPRKLQTAVNTHFRNFIVTVVVYHQPRAEGFGIKIFLKKKKKRERRRKE